MSIKNQEHSVNIDEHRLKVFPNCVKRTLESFTLKLHNEKKETKTFFMISPSVCYAVGGEVDRTT